MTKSAAQYVLSVNIEQKEKPMTQSTNQVCNDCNKTDGACCHDTIMTDNKASVTLSALMLTTMSF